MNIEYKLFLILTLILYEVIVRVVHGTGAKVISDCKQNMLYTKIQRIFCKKRISVLAGLKVSSLACKCVFCRPEHNAEGASHGTEFCKLRIMVIKMSKMAHFSYFLLTTAKNQSQFGKNISLHLKGLI